MKAHRILLWLAAGWMGLAATQGAELAPLPPNPLPRTMLEGATLKLEAINDAGVGRFMLTNNTDKPIGILTLEKKAGGQVFNQARFPAYQGRSNGQWKDLPVYYDGAEVHQAVASSKGTLELLIDLIPLVKVGGDSADFRVILWDQNTHAYLASEAFKFDKTKVASAAPVPPRPAAK